MTKKDYTHLSLVVDRSGSMRPNADEASGAINRLIEDQKEVQGKMTLTLADFDDKFEYHRVLAPIEGVEADYVLEPRGMTALYDAVGRVITETGVLLSNMDEGERPDKVIIAVVTDGQENCSKEWTLERVRELIKSQKEQYFWEFRFMGKDDAAWQGEQLGMGTTRYSGRRGYGETISVFSAAAAGSRVTGQSVASAMPDVVDSDKS